MRVLLIRHGPTQGNLEGRYIGYTDEPLSTAGRLRIEAKGVFPGIDEVFVSGLLRTRQTAQMLFPQARLIAQAGLNEMDFGDFEGRNAYDMRIDAAYRAWVDGDCAGPCPGGESQTDFGRRVEIAFNECLRQAFYEKRSTAIFVVHGGTIMAVMNRFSRPHKGYFDWQIGGGDCIEATAALKSWNSDPHLSRAKVCTQIPL